VESKRLFWKAQAVGEMKDRAHHFGRPVIFVLSFAITSKQVGI